jgi:hypothetical protein
VKGLEIEALKLPEPSSSDVGSGGDDEACLDACHRMLTAFAAKDAQALDDALDLYFDARKAREGEA